MTWFRPAPHPPFHAAVEHGRPRRTLEISSRSSDRLGRDLSAMNLPAAGDPHRRSVEAVYQAAKCYGDGGPDSHLSQSGYEAKRRDRERRRQGPLAGFRHEGRQWPPETGSAFYDWLWSRSALGCCGHGVVERLQRFDGFTDQFHRPGALACQAKAAAIVAGMGLARARAAIETPETWLSHMAGRAAPDPPAPKPAAPPSRVYAGIGSRQTPQAVLETMERIGRAMARHGWTLRSGAADGADTAFEAGAENERGPREIWLPWPGFKGRAADGAATRVGINSQANRDLARQAHPAWHVLREAVQKLMVRNVHQVLGPEPGSSPPSDVVICWTPDGAGEGGTGMAIPLAERHGVPVVDLGTRALPRLEAESRRGAPPRNAGRHRRHRPRRHARPGAGTGARRRAPPHPGDREPESQRDAHPGSPPRGDRREARSRRTDRRRRSASRGALDWADRRGHPTLAPPPRPAGLGRGEKPLEYASRMLQAKPGTVVECGGGWNAYDQAVRDGAAIARIRMERCRDVERTPTGVEHGLLQGREGAGPQAGRAGRRRPAARAPTAEPLRRRRPARVGQPAVDRGERPHRARRRPPAPGRRHPDDRARALRDRQPEARPAPRRGRVDHEGPAAPRPAGRAHRRREPRGAGPGPARSPDDRQRPRPRRTAGHHRPRQRARRRRRPAARRRPGTAAPAHRSPRSSRPGPAPPPARGPRRTTSAGNTGNIS